MNRNFSAVAGRAVRQESAGGKYGSLVKNERILDTEKYNVSVVA